MAEPSDQILKIIKWFDQCVMPYPEEGELFPPSLETTSDMADEAEQLWEVLERENGSFRKI